MADNTTNIEEKVEISTPEIVTEEIDLEGAEPNKVENKKPKEDKPIDQTKAFSERLNELTKKHKKEAEDAKKELEAIKAEIKGYKSLIETAKRLGYEGTPEEIAIQLRADNEGRTAEEIKADLAEEERRYLERKKNDPDFQKVEELKKELEALKFAELRKTHYEEIKAEYPDIKAKNMDELIKELGKPFIDRLSKGIDAVDAYELTIKKLPKQEPAEKPPTTGSTKSSGKIETDGLFSKEEYEKITSVMSEREKVAFVKKNYDKVMKSKEKWK